MSEQKSSKGGILNRVVRLPRGLTFQSRRTGTSLGWPLLQVFRSPTLVPPAHNESKVIQLQLKHGAFLEGGTASGVMPNSSAANKSMNGLHLLNDSVMFWKVAEGVTCHKVQPVG
jgi:hypothetical protein